MEGNMKGSNTVCSYILRTSYSLEPELDMDSLMARESLMLISADRLTYLFLIPNQVKQASRI